MSGYEAVSGAGGWDGEGIGLGDVALVGPGVGLKGGKVWYGYRRMGVWKRKCSLV